MRRASASVGALIRETAPSLLIGAVSLIAVYAAPKDGTHSAGI